MHYARASTDTGHRMDTLQAGACYAVMAPARRMQLDARLVAAQLEEDMLDVPRWREVAPPAAHEWWTRRASLGLGALCTTAGGIALAQASVLQTPLGATALYAWEQAYGPHAGAHDAVATFKDWAMAEAVVLGAQAGSLMLISMGFVLVAYAVH